MLNAISKKNYLKKITKQSKYINLIFLEEIDSTNKYAKENIAQIPDRTIVYTDNQTAGRGRLNRKWTYTGKDNIYAIISRWIWK